MQAQYSSRCSSCGERIEEGDDIFRDDELDAWVCEGCEPAPLRIIKPKPAKKKGPSLAERLEGSEPASVASTALKNFRSVAELYKDKTCSMHGCTWQVIGELHYGERTKAYFCKQHEPIIGGAR